MSDHVKKPNIVLFCENNHFDRLALAVELFTINGLDSGVWKHYLIEGEEQVKLYYEKSSVSKDPDLEIYKEIYRNDQLVLNAVRI